MSIFSFKPFFYREYIFWCNDFLSFWVTSTQFIFFCPFKKDYMQNFVWKDNNQNFKFYSISPLGRNRIKHLSSTLKSHHRWAEIELMYANICSSKLNSSDGSNLIRGWLTLLQRNKKIHFFTLTTVLYVSSQKGHFDAMFTKDFKL